MSKDKTEPIDGLRRAIAALEAKQKSSGVDLSVELAPLYEMLEQREIDSVVNLGSGSIATDGGMSAGQGGVVVGRDNLGDVLINSIKIIFPDYQQAAEEKRLIGYLNFVIKDCTPLNLIGIDQGAANTERKPLPLAGIYVDLNVDLRLPSNQTLAAFLSSGEKQELTPEARKERQPLRRAAVLEALACHRALVLLGAPGSGKSTFARYLALKLAAAGLGDQDALSCLGTEWTHGPLVPIHVVLRKFAAGLSADLTAGRAGHLWSFLDQELLNSGLPEATGPLLRGLADKTGVLFLFDGLDEAGDENRRTRVLEAAVEFMRNASDKCRFLLTARPYAWEDIDWNKIDDKSPRPASYKLAEFDSEQIQTFIQRWYEALRQLGWVGPTDAAEKMPSLQQAVRQAGLQSLAQNPLLLTLMATLHTNRGRLPDDRADLYDEVVKLLLQRWNEPIGADRSLLAKLNIPSLTLAQLRDVMEEVAYDAHAAHIGEEGTADISEAALRLAFSPLLAGSWDKAAQVIDYIENRAGLLIGKGARDQIRQFAFPHRTFQEYLAGCYLALKGDFCRRAAMLARQSPDHWREVLALAARKAGHERGVSAADELVHSLKPDERRRQGQVLDEGDWRSAILAGEMLLELGTASLESRDQSKAVRARVAAWLVALIEGDALPAHERVQAGRIVGRLGDPRFRRDSWYLPDEPLLGFVEIPKGEFQMGRRKEDIPYLVEQFGGDPKWYEEETPRHPVNLPRYYIGRYPVTVAQFKAFVDDSTYISQDKNCLSGPPNCPVVSVSWHDARAYCSWLDEKLRSWTHTPEPLASLMRKSGWRISLPTEAEWEKAARGTEGRILPWGNELDPNRANYPDTGIAKTSSVGCFPTGISPYGCLDMAGNVWEWCQSKYERYPYVAGDGREDLTGIGVRVVRGGSFGDIPGYVRCASRGYGRPDSRGGDVGFRVVVVSPGSRF